MREFIVCSLLRADPYYGYLGEQITGLDWAQYALLIFHLLAGLSIYVHIIVHCICIATVYVVPYTCPNNYS